MARMKLELANLKALDDGKVSALFQQAVQAVIKDCLDRPADESARTVKLEMQVKPVSANGDAVSVEFTVKTSVPAKRTRPYEMAPHAGGYLIFNDASDDDAHQGTLDELKQ